MRTEMPMLNEEICCWIYNINPSESQCPMTARVRSGRLEMCMAMALTERRECSPTPSGANMSLAAPARLHSALMAVGADRSEALGGWIVSDRSGRIASMLLQS